MQGGMTKCLRLAVVAALLVTSCGRQQPAGGHQPQRLRVSQFHMGMMVHLTLWVPNIQEGQRAAAAAFKRIGEIDQIMSDYEPDSELSRLCRQSGQGPVLVTSEMFALLSRSRRLAELTDGRFDPTVGPLSRLWRQAKQTQHPPSQEAVDTALSLVGYRKLLLATNAQTAELTQPGMLLDLGGIAKGYAGDEAIRILREQGISCAAYEAGGDKVFGSAPPGTAGWHIATDQGFPELPPMANCAVSMSGDSTQHYQHKGRRIGHIVDPRTGPRIANHIHCIVVAPRGIDSDPLSTVGTIMQQAPYRELLKHHFPGALATIFEARNDSGPDDPRIPPLDVTSYDRP